VPDLNFYEQVYDIVRLIPKGRVTTYGAIAKAMGMARSSRMVGTAMMHAHDPRLKVPAHRVVNRIGLLTGKHHYDTPTQMQDLLEAEGIMVRDDQVENFKTLFWNPLTEI
jgi:methylated-DNA-protein-cysteine methyltransferase-like protein